MGLLIKRGTIWFQNNWVVGDILVKDGRIEKIKANIEVTGNNQRLDAEGLIVVPGFIDMHVHLREPGFEEKETIKTGLQAAARGGFTTIAVMPNTNPITDNPGLIEWVKGEAEAVSNVKVLPIGAITKAEKGKELTPFEQMKDKGAIGFSDDGKGIQYQALMRSAMEKAKSLHAPIFAHCEDEEIAGDGVIHAGVMAEKLKVPGIPSEAEYVQLERDLLLAEETGVHYHVCHVSTKESVQLIKEAKARGVKVTAEVTPHHLLLTDNEIKEPYSQYKMNPPLRSEEDRIALIAGIVDGTIDIIATDHAPHTNIEKNQELLKAPFGIVGLETAFPLLYTLLVKKNLIGLDRLIEMMSTKPAELFNLPAGEIKVGATADLTIIDLINKTTVNTDEFLSKGKNTPFSGWELKGWPKYTIADGKLVYVNHTSKQRLVEKKEVVR